MQFKNIDSCKTKTYSQSIITTISQVESTAGQMQAIIPARSPSLLLNLALGYSNCIFLLVSIRILQSMSPRSSQRGPRKKTWQAFVATTCLCRTICVLNKTQAYLEKVFYGQDVSKYCTSLNALCWSDTKEEYQARLDWAISDPKLHVYQFYWEQSSGKLGIRIKAWEFQQQQLAHCFHLQHYFNRKYHRNRKAGRWDQLRYENTVLFTSHVVQLACVKHYPI